MSHPTSNLPRPEDPQFEEDELLFRAVPEVGVRDRRILGSTIDGLPRPSFNRGRYGGPEDARAAKPNFELVAITSAGRVTGNVEKQAPDQVNIIAAPVDRPTWTPGGFSHCEVLFWRTADTQEAEWSPSRSQKTRMREWLAARPVVMDEASPNPST